MAQGPKHIGIILDGNRRFAKRLMMKPWKGHEWGAGKVEKLFDWAHKLGVTQLTLYAFSMQNFKRPQEEFDYLMDVFRKEFEKLKTDPRLEEYGIRCRWIGRTYLLPDDIQSMIKDIEERTKGNSSFKVNFAMAYGGQSEIVDAMKKAYSDVQAGNLKVEELDEKKLGEYMYINEGPDIIIRTGGERRTSNFLNYQSAYSEWFYLDKMWPEFEEDDLIKVVQDFKDRERRFGK